MSRMSELDMEIRDALDMYRGPKNYKSCEEIATMMNIPVQMIHDVVEMRWNELIGDAA